MKKLVSLFLLLILSSPSWAVVTSVKESTLPAATTLADSDKVRVVVSGDSANITYSAMKAQLKLYNDTLYAPYSTVLSQIGALIPSSGDSTYYNGSTWVRWKAGDPGRKIYDSSSYASLTACIAALGSTNPVDLAITRAESFSGTIPANYTLHFYGDGVLTVGASNITILGKIEASARQIFNYTSTGVIVLNGAIAQIYPEWWGADPTGGVDSSAAFQYAVDAAGVLAAGAALVGGGVEICLTGYQYKIDSKVNITQHAIGVSGALGRGTKLVGPGIIFDIGDYTLARQTTYVTINNISFYSSDGATTAAAVKLYRTTRVNITECKFNGFYVGIDSYRSSTTFVSKCWSSGATRTTQALAFIQLQGLDETDFSTSNDYAPGGGMHITDCEGAGLSYVPAVSADTDAFVLIKSVDGFYMTQCHFTGYVDTVLVAPEATPENYNIGDVVIEGCYFDEPSHLATTHNIRFAGTVKDTILMADGVTNSVSMYQTIRLVNNYFRGGSVAARNIVIEVADGDSWWNNPSRKLRDIVITGNTIQQSLYSGILIKGASSSNIEPYGVVITGNSFWQFNSSATGSVGGAIHAQAEQISIVGNTFDYPAGTCDYIVFVVATDAGNDYANPSASIVGNNFSACTATIDLASITHTTTSPGQSGVVADNVYPGAGRVLKQQYKLTTTDATTTTIWDWTIPAGIAGYAKVMIAGSNATGAKAVAYEFEAGFRNNGSSSSLNTGGSGSSFTSVLAWNPDTIATIPTATLATDTLRVQVTGVAAETWTWVCSVDLSACK